MLKTPRQDDIENLAEDANPSLAVFRLEYATVLLIGLLLILVVVGMVRIESRLTAAHSAVSLLGARFPSLDIAETMAALVQENKQLTADLIESKAAIVRLERQVADMTSSLTDPGPAAQASPCDASAATAPRQNGRQLDRLVSAIKSAVPY